MPCYAAPARARPTLVQPQVMPQVIICMYMYVCGPLEQVPMRVMGLKGHGQGAQHLLQTLSPKIGKLSMPSASYVDNICNEYVRCLSTHPHLGTVQPHLGTWPARVQPHLGTQ